MKKTRNNAFVGSTRHFDNEIDLASSEGQFSTARRSEDTFSSPVCLIVLMIDAAVTWKAETRT